MLLPINPPIKPKTQLLRLRNKAGIWRQCAPWLNLVTYSLSSAVLTTVGRGRDTQVFLLDSRYTTFPLYAIVGLLFLLPILFGYPGSQRWRTWLAALAALFLTLHARNSRHAIREMKLLHSDRLQAKACLAFTNVINAVCQTQSLDWNFVELKQVARAIATVGYAHPPLATSSDPRSISAQAEAPNQ